MTLRDLQSNFGGVKVKNLSLIILVLLVVLAVTGCANQPAFCPEVRVNFCPAK